MKKLLAVVLAVMLMTSSLTYADNNNDITYLTLEKAIALAQLESTALEQNDLKLEIAEREYEDLMDELDDLDTSHSNADDYEALVLKQDYEPTAKQIEIQNIKKEKEDLQNQLEIEVTNAYLQLKEATSQFATTNDDYMDSKITYENKMKEYDLGRITENDLKTYELEMLRMETSLFEAEQTLILTRMSFNQMIGYALDTPVTLISVVDTSVNINYNITLLISNISTFDDTIKDAEEALKLAKLKFQVVDDNIINKTIVVNDRVTDPYGRPSDYYTLQDNVEEAEISLENKINEAKLTLRLDYNTLKSKEIGVKIAELTNDTAKRSYESNKIKYDLGLITYQTYMQSVYEYKKSIEAYKTAENDLYIAYLQFDTHVSDDK